MASPLDVTPAGTTGDLVSDVYALSDDQLASSLEFIKEIGFGNWGSVWSCRSRLGSAAQTRRRLAVKLVHRTSDRTTPARVRSLWNEMKIVRTLKDERHPAIIDFHSFIITPSYALVTMEFLPSLVPVEVKESKAKIWFESLLGGVAYLHRRGIVHNDIKPANILLSRSEQPVLVDFGFAEKYDVTNVASTSNSPRPFESCLSYGTVEYLSPERARGLAHDTRKSDVWSLGVTFFEIIAGRTPFELDDGEEFSSKEDLERYWGRTNKGSWVGTWSMSAGLEKILKRMICPRAEHRTTASEALLDSYFLTPTIDAEIVSTIRIDVTGKKVMQSILPFEPFSPAPFSATSPDVSCSSASPPSFSRNKLAALQNFIVKQRKRKFGNKRNPRSNRVVASIPASLPVTPIVHASEKPKPTSVQKENKSATPSSLSKAFSHLRSKSHTPAPPIPSISRPITPVIKHQVPPSPGRPRTPSESKDNSAPTAILRLQPIIPPQDRSLSNTSGDTRFRPSLSPPPKVRPTTAAPTPLLPVPGKENGAVKVKTNRAVGASDSPKKGDTNMDTVPVGSKTAKSMLRIKNRNRKEQVNLDMTAPAPLGLRDASVNTEAKPSAKRASVKVKRDSSSIALRKENIIDTGDKKKTRRSFQLGTKSTEARPGSARGRESGLSSLRHTVRKSIDKTAERLGKLSTAGNSLPKRNGKSRQSATELMESWDDLEKERNTKVATANLSVVIDESFDESTLVAEAPDSKKPEDTEPEKGRVDRLTVWLQNVEKVVEETRSEFQREASEPLSRRASSRPMLLVESRVSTEPALAVPSLPPPKRRATLSSAPSKRPSTIDGHQPSHSVQDLGLGWPRSTEGGLRPGSRLSAVLDPEDRKLYLQTRYPSKQPSYSSFSSSFHITSPTVPTIEVMDTSASDDPMASTSIAPPKESWLGTRRAVSADKTSLHISSEAMREDSKLSRSVSASLFHGHWTPSSRPAPESLNLSSPEAPINPSEPLTPPPLTPPAEAESLYDRFLLATSNVVRLGKGYQSEHSLRASSKRYHAHHPMEYIVGSEWTEDAVPASTSPAFDEPLQLSTRSKTHRRGGIFATLRGKEQAEAIAFASEFGAKSKSFDLRRSGSEALLTDQPPRPSTADITRNNTLTLRVKRVFMRVVSSPVVSRTQPIAIPV